MSNHGLQNSEKNLALFKVLGKFLGYFEGIVMEFRGYFLLFMLFYVFFSANLRYFPLYYNINNILHYFI